MIDAKLTPWIPVEAALPSDGQLVLVAWTAVVHRHAMGSRPAETVTIGPNIDVVTYDAKDGGYWDGGLDLRVGDPLWWMPVPDLPDGGLR